MASQHTRFFVLRSSFSCMGWLFVLHFFIVGQRTHAVQCRSLLHGRANIGRVYCLKKRSSNCASLFSSTSNAICVVIRLKTRRLWVACQLNDCIDLLNHVWRTKSWRWSSIAPTFHHTQCPCDAQVPPSFLYALPTTHINSHAHTHTHTHTYIYI